MVYHGKRQHRIGQLNYRQFLKISLSLLMTHQKTPSSISSTEDLVFTIPRTYFDSRPRSRAITLWEWDPLVPTRFYFGKAAILYRTRISSIWKTMSSRGHPKHVLLHFPQVIAFPAVPTTETIRRAQDFEGVIGTYHPYSPISFATTVFDSCVSRRCICAGGIDSHHGSTTAARRTANSYRTPNTSVLEDLSSGNAPKKSLASSFAKTRPARILIQGSYTRKSLGGCCMGMGWQRD